MVYSRIESARRNVATHCLGSPIGDPGVATATVAKRDARCAGYRLQEEYRTAEPAGRYPYGVTGMAIWSLPVDWYPAPPGLPERRPVLVLGIGTDLMEIARIERSVARFGEPFLRRIFTPGEIAYCMAKKKTSGESFAARFAAKEAGAKALGTGISRGVGWLELEVTRAPGERPILKLTGRAADRASSLGVAHISLSLTHSRDTALAVVIMES